MSIKLEILVGIPLYPILDIDYMHRKLIGYTVKRSKLQIKEFLVSRVPALAIIV